MRARRKKVRLGAALAFLDDEDVGIDRVLADQERDDADHAAAANWAVAWRDAVQGYTHAYRAATGVDLTQDASAGVRGDSLKTLLSNGNAYVNVHTGNFPDGEIRGQVMLTIQIISR